MRIKKLKTYELFRLAERAYFSDIEQTEVGLEITANVCLLTCVEIKVYDAKLVGPLCHQRKQARREDVDAGESK